MIFYNTSKLAFGGIFRTNENNDELMRNEKCNTREITEAKGLSDCWSTGLQNNTQMVGSELLASKAKCFFSMAMKMKPCMSTCSIVLLLQC